MTETVRERTRLAHLKHLDITSSHDFEILFLGDSMLERWQSTGSKYWKKDLSKYKIMNASVGGDTINNLLWRIQPTDHTTGILDSLRVKKIILMIGTNNIEKDIQ